MGFKSDQVKTFYNNYIQDHLINRRFFFLVDEKDYDFKISERSDSVRKNIAHIIAIRRNYIESIKTKELEFNDEKYNDLEPKESKSKKELLKKLDEEVDHLVEVLNFKDFNSILVKTPWGKAPALSVLLELRNHEILHTGMNIVFMDALNIPRFDEMKAIWG